MSNLINVREQVLEEINQLNQEKLNVVLRFLHSLKSSDNQTIDDDEIIDPLADFIGAVNSGNLAKNIEQDLYGIYSSSLVKLRNIKIFGYLIAAI